MSTEVENAGYCVGALDELPLDEFRVFEIDGREVGVLRTARGVFAVWNRCPHQGAAICAGRVGGTMGPSGPGTYRFDDDRLVLACPWHRWEFDVETGKSVEDATPKRLLTFPVTVHEGQVFVKTPRRRR